MNETITWVAGCIVALAAIAGIAWAIQTGYSNDLILKSKCIEAGGVVTYESRCVWSKKGGE